LVTAQLGTEAVLSDALKARWNESGLHRGDLVLLHSSISRLMRALKQEIPDFTVTDLLNCLLDVLGSDGTLLLPTFNFSFCDGKGYDLSQTPSAMGSLTEVARLDSRFARTSHPVYSFVVCGPQSLEFLKLRNVSALADDGPFGTLRRLKGKIAVLDLDDQNSQTFYHHIEEINQVDYRYHKSFTGLYKDGKGVETLQTCQLFVWDEEKGTRTDVNRAGELLWHEGLYTGDRPGVEGGLRVIDAQRMFVSVSEIIRRGEARDYLYSIEEDGSP
jgi:aminoglycoside 3-N-acetyltransferase